ncbi:DUF4177 domain-containing protein [Peribacillus deserti]
MQENAQEGWRFVQLVAPDMATNCLGSYFDLIFERPLDGFYLL